METESSLVNIGPSKFIDSFTLMDARLETGIKMRFAIGGNGPALMLVHGHPHTHIIWRKVAPLLAQKYTVVLPDLRGYGDTDKPESTPDHRPYSKKRWLKTSSL